MLKNVGVTAPTVWFPCGRLLPNLHDTAQRRRAVKTSHVLVSTEDSFMRPSDTSLGNRRSKNHDKAPDTLQIIVNRRVNKHQYIHVLMRQRILPDTPQDLHVSAPFRSEEIRTESEHDDRAAYSVFKEDTKIREVDLAQPLMHVRPRRLYSNIVALLEIL